MLRRPVEIASPKRTFNRLKYDGVMDSLRPRLCKNSSKSSYAKFISHSAREEASNEGSLLTIQRQVELRAPLFKIENSFYTASATNGPSRSRNPRGILPAGFKEPSTEQQSDN